MLLNLHPNIKRTNHLHSTIAPGVYASPAWLYILLVVALACGGCKVPAAPQTPPPATPTVSRPAITPSPSATPTATLPAATPTKTPLPTRTATRTPRPTETATATPTITATYPPAALVVSDDAFHLSWTWQAGEQLVWDQFTVGADGWYYLFAYDGSLYALDAQGQMQWSYRSESLPASPPVLSQDEMTVYFAAYPDWLYALDHQGQLLWMYQAPAEIVETPYPSPNSDVYLMIEEDSIVNWVRLSSQGVQLPFQWPDEYEYSWQIEDLQFGAEGEIIFLTRESIEILAADGQRLRSCKPSKKGFPYSENLAVAPRERLILYDDGSSETTQIIALDMRCQERWRTGVDESLYPADLLDFPPLDGPAFDTYIHNQRLVVSPEGVLYRIGPSGMILAFDMQGNLIWRTPVDKQLGYILAIALGSPGQIFAFSSMGYIAAFDASGQRLWKEEFFEPGIPIEIHPTVAGGVAFVHGGYLQVYSRDPGQAAAARQPAPQPKSEIHAREEIEQFLLELVIYGRIGWKDGRYHRSTGEPWKDEPARAALLILGPPYYGEMSEEFEIDWQNPIQVWWFVNGWLLETGDMQRSIKEYERIYIDPIEEWDAHAWLWYDFGILSISSDLQHAEVYLGSSCGPACGRGMHYWLQRSPSGRWWIQQEKHLWDS